MRISDWSSDVCSSDLGTIDSDYRGELKIIMINHGNESFPIKRGDRVAQIVPAAVQRARFAEVEELDETVRGVGGFGRSEEHTSELQSLMRISYAVFCLKKKRRTTNRTSQISGKQIEREIHD